MSDERSVGADGDTLRELVAEVAAAYFSNSHVTPTEIPNVIGQIAASLRSVGEGSTQGGGEEPTSAKPAKLTSGQIRKSITPDALISFEDGRPYKILKRHLAALGLTPDDYRAKWGLPYDYPMVAPNQSAARSQIARQVGFWRKDVHGSRSKAL